MSIIEEQYIQINLWCRPLARTNYSFDEIRKAKLHPRSDGTSTLLAAMREKERREDAATRALMQEKRANDAVHAEYTNALSEFSEAYAGFSKSEIADSIAAEEQSASVDETPDIKVRPHRLNRLRTKVATALFDYSEIEQEKIEEEINELVNADGYYDEVEPVDVNEDYEEEKSINPTVILLVGVLIIFLAASALYFHFLF